MSSLTESEKSDIEFYNSVHASNAQKVNGIWRSIRDESEAINSLSDEDQRRYRRGRDFDNIDNWSINGVPVTVDDARKMHK